MTPKSGSIVILHRLPHLWSHRHHRSQKLLNCSIIITFQWSCQTPWFTAKVSPIHHLVPTVLNNRKQRLISGRGAESLHFWPFLLTHRKWLLLLASGDLHRNQASLKDLYWNIFFFFLFTYCEKVTFNGITCKKRSGMVWEKTLSRQYDGSPSTLTLTVT